MIIDLFGIPGSGKTCYGISLENEHKGKSFNYLRFERETLTGKAFHKLIVNIFKVFPRRKHQYIINKYVGYGKYNKRRKIKFYLDRIDYLNFLYKLIPKKIYLIVDEGLLHTIATMHVDFQVEDEDVIELLQINFPQMKKQGIYPIYQYADISTAEESIRIRDRHVTAIDELKGEGLKNFLEFYQHACELISNFTNAKVHKRKVKD